MRLLQGMNAVQAATAFFVAVVASITGCADREPVTAGHTSLSLTRIDLPVVAAWEMSAIAGLDWQSDSVVALVDADLRQLLFYDLYSGATRRYLREGSGPGELGIPGDLLSTPRGVLIADARHRRIAEFDAAGRYLRSVTVNGLPLKLLATQNEEIIVTIVPLAMSSAGPTISTVNLESGKVMHEIRPWAVDSVLATPSPISRQPSPFISTARAADGSYLAAVGHDYHITRISPDGRKTTAITRDIQAPAWLPDEADNLRRQTRALGGASNSKPVQDALAKVLESPKPHYGTNALVPDENGRLWVLTSRRTSDSTEVDVFAEAGAFLRTLTLRDKVERLRIRLPYVLAIVERTSGEYEGYKSIDLYRINQ